MARWCDGGRTQRSRLGTLTDKAVKTAKRRVAESALDKVYVGNEALDNVLHFEYLGSQLQGDGDDEADVRHRMDIAQAAFGSLVCRLVYICIHFCYTLGNHDYFLRNTYLSGKNVVAIFSVWSRGHFQHKMYKNMNITRKN